MKSAFATLESQKSDIKVFHTDCGNEFNNAEINLMLEAFGIEQSLSAEGCPYDNALNEAADKMLKTELVYRESYRDLHGPQLKLPDYVR